MEENIEMSEHKVSEVINFIKKEFNEDEPLTPRQIVAELDKYIIGQDKAKHAVAIALRNRWRRQKADASIREEIMPNNIIMIGPTGVGKTEIARRLAKLANAPFIKVEATKYTEVGYVGRDVESMIRDLAERSVQMLRNAEIAKTKNVAKAAAENRILDILVPPKRNSSREDNDNENEMQEDGNGVSELILEDNSSTREKFRKMLHDGKLNDKTVEIDVVIDQASSMQILGPIGMDEMGMNLQDLFGSIMPKKSKKIKMKIPEAMKIIEAQEADKLIDMDRITREAVNRAEYSGIVFIDEIDKVANRGTNNNGGDVSREGVQRDLLPIVEGTTVNTKYGPVKTEHILFIASGAFSLSKPSDLVPELQGRFPIRVELASLTEEDFVKILTQPENALTKQYAALMKSEGINLEFTSEAIHEIAKSAAFVNSEVTNIGARRLHTILTALLDDVMYNTPDNITDKDISITAEMVKSHLDGIVANSDLSKYIL